MSAVPHKSPERANNQSSTNRVICPKPSRRWVLLATILASAMAFIDGTVVNVALPALQTGMNATAIDVQWVIEAYSLLLSALLLMGGSLGDHYGRRRIFLFGVAIFAVASAGCGAAVTIRQLIIFRAVQGFGAALLIPGSLAIISASFPEEERGRAIGTWSGASAITTAIGPVLGGWLIEHFSWRAAFYINVPIAALVVLFSLRHVPETTNRASSRIDWLGAILASTGLGALVYGLIESSRMGFGAPVVIAVLFAAIMLLSTFVMLERRLSQPMLPLDLFRSRTFTGANVITLLLYGALGGTLFFVPLDLIQVQHYSATSAGASLLPFILLISLLSRWSGGMLVRFGARPALIAGPLIAAAGFALFAIPGVGGSYWQTFFPAVAVLGLGMAITIAPLTTTVMSAVEQDRAGIASGVNNAVARSAGLLAIAVLGVVMLHVFGHVLDRNLEAAHVPLAAIHAVSAQKSKLAAADLPSEFEWATRRMARSAVDESFVTGFRTVMCIGAVLSVAGAITAFALIAGKSQTDPRSNS
jgi:EmrB/QacA subfamily drug resistance transporter